MLFYISNNHNAYYDMNPNHNHAFYAVVHLYVSERCWIPSFLRSVRLTLPSKKKFMA